MGLRIGPSSSAGVHVKRNSTQLSVDLNYIHLSRRKKNNSHATVTNKMVKAVIGEESQLKLAEDRLSQSALPSQVGLVIGKLSKSLDRGFVFDLIPTPPNDAGEPACSLIEGVKDDRKKGPKGKPAQADSSALFIDKDWVAEHARQVSRMLLGGMKVVGIYVWLSETSFKNSTLILCQTVKAVAEAAPFLESNWDDRLLIHISYSPRRWACRNCSLSTNITSSNLRPCDFKMGKVLTALQTFRCTYNIDLRLPICRENGSDARRLSDILRSGISNHAKELKSAKALIDGKLVIDDDVCSSDNLHSVEFLLPFMQDKYVEACSQKEVVGVLTLCGLICSFAYLNSKEPISQALADIKEDILLSLQSRLDIMCDEADREANSATDGREATNQMANETPVPELILQLQRETCNLSLPRRVFVPWLAGLNICDYIQPSETVEVVKDHCVELMSMGTPPDASIMSEPESDAPTLTSSSVKSFWDVAVPLSCTPESVPPDSKKSRSTSSPGIDRKTVKLSDINIIAAVLVLFVSILVGVFFFAVRAS